MWVLVEKPCVFRGKSPGSPKTEAHSDGGNPGKPGPGRLSSKINGKFIVVYIIWWFLNIGYD